MIKTAYKFSAATSVIYQDASFESLKELVAGELVIITDENIYAAHRDKLDIYPCIVIPAGEQYKQQSTIDQVITELIERKADRQTFILGVGGGVVTDMAGYAASIYMRGLKFGFVPTSILAMVDASIGGKNGIDVGVYKNMVGIIRQPEFILYDVTFLHSLPETEWINGFAEIIKHACIKDASMFEQLQQHRISDFRNNPGLLKQLIARNVSIKLDVVLNDEFEQGERKLLNFGHTIGHAIENLHKLPHGHAVSIGMVAAAKLSEELNGFNSADKEQLVNLLQQYQLPVSVAFDKTQLFNMMQSDKKRSTSTMNFILLNRIGDAVICPVGMEQLKSLVDQVL